MPKQWSGFPYPRDPGNAWIDDVTGEIVDAHTGERRPCPYPNFRPTGADSPSCAHERDPLAPEYCRLCSDWLEEESNHA